MKEKTTEHEECPTCGGQGYMYQTEAQLGGDYFREKPDCLCQKVPCPRCDGAGKIAKIVTLILAAAIAFYCFC